MSPFAGLQQQIATTIQQVQSILSAEVAAVVQFEKATMAQLKTLTQQFGGSGLTGNTFLKAMEGSPQDMVIDQFFMTMASRGMFMHM
jgi:hypothetical protein